MATSGVTTSSLTVANYVDRALELLGVLRPGATRKTAHGTLAIQHLNSMLKQMQTDGGLWLEQDFNLTWTADVPDGTLDPDILDVMDVRVATAAGYETQLERWERDEYARIGDKTQSGTPTIYSVVKERDEHRLRLWPVPSASTSLKVQARRVIHDVTALTETIDVPQHWQETIWTMLADRLAPVFGVTATPEAQIISARAGALYASQTAFQRSGSIFMQPSYWE